MPIEIKGQQLRIRIKNPNRYKSFLTHDVGSKGRLQRIVGITKDKKFETQSWRFNLSDYRDYKDFNRDLSILRIPDYKKIKARQLAKKWFKG